MKRLHVGCLIVCIKCDDYPEIIGHVGEILAKAESSWKCRFPALQELKCPDCGRYHKVGSWTMGSDEIKPIEDPDQSTVDETVEELQFGFS